MALVSDGFFLTVNLVDSGSNVTSKTFELTAGTLALAVTDAATILTRLNAVTDCVVSGYSIGQRFTEDALVLPADTEHENRARITAYIEGQGTKKVNADIPGASIGIFAGATGEPRNTVDIADADLVAYLSTFQTGGLATISDGEVMGALISGRRIHVKSSKG